ncbi:MAG: hypothetical protein LUI14_07445 [Lachnospiraceae bacterium]|nr:hypothetical protein [Lachnospiraceae bacterium]
MAEDTSKSLINELWNSIKYAYESKKGKLSLDTYLDIVGEYADQLIEKTEEKDHLIYQGGYCEVSQLSDSYRFDVKLYFRSDTGEDILKEASRDISKERFVTETKNMLETTKKYEIFKADRR